MENKNEFPQSPFAKYQGVLPLGDNEIDCYVSDTGQRLVSMRSSLKAIANRDGGGLAEYIGVNALKPFINADSVLAGLIELNIPGTQYKAKCLEARQLLSVCRAYVTALSAGSLETDRQRDIAFQCSILLGACADIGLEALIDEATGYQHIRREDELQLKLKLYIADELREWEKTFPDELWEEFGRLTGWKTPLQHRPKYWGKLVIELIYDTLDAEVAEYLKNNKPEPGICWHQQLTDSVGVRQLMTRCYEVIGIAKTCDSIKELRGKVGHYYHKKPCQMVIKFAE